MRPTFRKLEVKDIGNLERLVVENSDGVEPGLMIVDSRLLLGQTAIDLVALDGTGSLVLIALSFSADDGLLLRAMDAYSWCLEYPDTLRRLYPMAKASSRPPRILFIVEKMTDAFLRRIKQLSVLEIDCFAFRHLEVNGAPVVYFDLVERLRKSIVESKVSGPTPAPGPTPASATPAKTAEARIKPRSVGARVEPAKPSAEWSTLVESRAAVREPKRVDPPKTVAVEPVRVEPAAVVAAPVQPATPIVALRTTPAPVAEEPRTVAAAQTASVAEFQMVKLEAEPAVALESIESTSRPHTNGHVPEPAVASVVEATPSVVAPIEAPEVVVAAAGAAFDSAPAPLVPEAPAPDPVQASPVWAKSGAQANGTRPHFFTPTTKSNTPVEAPATAPTAEPATQPAASKVGLEVDDRPELESLSFPKDGLSRQWLEFLSQLGATK